MSYKPLGLALQQQQDKDNFAEKLIDAIKRHGCLFDRDLESYRKKRLKQEAWAQVAAETGVGVSECQHRWRSLRDRYVREAKANVNGNRKWRFLSKLKFLSPQLDLKRCSKQSTDEDTSNTLHSFNTPEYWVNNQHSKTFEPPAHQANQREQGCKSEVKSESLPFVSVPNCNISLGVCDWNEDKNRRVDSQALNAGSSRVGMVTDDEELASIVDETQATPKSRNEDYYKTLDSYMLQLPLNVQDGLKIEILNRVYDEIKRHSYF